MDAVAGQKPLGREAQNPAVGHQASRVVKRIVVQQRQAERDDDALRGRQNFAEQRRRPSAARRAKETRLRSHSR